MDCSSPNLDSAENPLGGKKWWLESDEPWQTLSVCYEIKKALECADGAEHYVSHVPIHQVDIFHVWHKPHKLKIKVEVYRPQYLDLL